MQFVCSRARSTFQSALGLARLSPRSDEKEATLRYGAYILVSLPAS